MRPEKIDRYIIEETLGNGAMGSVYRARDPVIERTVAIKTIRVEHLSGKKDRKLFRARFYREAKIVGVIDHPGVVALYDMGEHEGMPFIVMEYVQGQSLDQLIDGCQLDGETICSIVSQLGSALEAAHGMGVVHRDIKPGNIMVNHDGKVKVLDFGIARLGDGELTATGEFLGTPIYSSPEQIVDGEVDHRTDLFAFGIVVHKLLTGQDAFAGSTIKNIFYQIIHGEPKLRESYKDLGIKDTHLHAIVRKALHRNPNRRYQSATILARDVKALFSGKDISLSGFEQPYPDDRRHEAETRTMARVDLAEELPRGDEQASGTDQARRIQQLREQFRTAVGLGNLPTCRSLIKLLARRDADVDNEREVLQQLEEEIAHTKAVHRDKLVAMRRQAFVDHISSRDLNNASLVLEGLRELEANVDDEVRTLQRETLALNERRDRERRNFKETIRLRNLQGAKATLRRLRALGDDPAELEPELLRLESEKLDEARGLLEEITRYRAAFQAAIEAEDVEEATLALARLRHFNAPERDEAQRLEDMRARLSGEHRAEALRLQEAVQRALDDGQLDRAAAMLEHLESLSEIDTKKVEKLGSRLEMAQQRFRAERIKYLEKAFEQELNLGNTGGTRIIQQELSQLGADSPIYRWLLRKAAGKAVGPRPGGRKPLLFVAGGLLALAAVVIYFFY